LKTEARLGKRNLLNEYRENGIITILILLVIVFVYGAITVPYFFKANFWMSIWKTYVPVALMSLGLGVVIIGGGSDMSCGSTSSLCCVVIIYTHMAWGWSIPASCLAGMLCGVLCGAFKGAMVTYVRLNPLLSTFAFSWVAEGIGQWIAPHPQVIGAAMDISKLYGKKPLGIPTPVWMLLVCLLVWAVIKRTSLGIHVYAMGNDFNRAYATGINYQRTRMMTYLFCGLMSGVAGIALTGLIGAASYSYGSALNVQAIASCVVGGVPTGGGVGTILGAAIGAIFFGILSQVVMAVVTNIYFQSLVNYLLVFLCIALPVIWKAVRNKRV
jgi:ribose transport system permease protein